MARLSRLKWDADIMRVPRSNIRGPLQQAFAIHLVLEKTMLDQHLADAVNGGYGQPDRLCDLRGVDRQVGINHGFDNAEDSQETKRPCPCLLAIVQSFSQPEVDSRLPSTTWMNYCRIIAVSQCPALRVREEAVPK